MVKSGLVAEIEDAEHVFINGFLIRPDDDGLLRIEREDVFEALAKLLVSEDLGVDFEGAVAGDVDDDFPDLPVLRSPGIGGGDGNVQVFFPLGHAEGDDEKDQQDEQDVDQGHKIHPVAGIGAVTGAEVHIT